MNLLRRLLNVWVAEDEAANAALGGKPTETLSGSIGRAALAGKWWALRIAEPVVDGLPLFSPGHCRRQAQLEAARREQGS